MNAPSRFHLVVKQTRKDHMKPLFTFHFSFLTLSTTLSFCLILFFCIDTAAQTRPQTTSVATRPMTANDSIQQELKTRIRAAKDKARASRSQLKEDEREVNRLTRELERARTQAQKEKLAARKAKAKGKTYTQKTVKVQMDNPKTVAAQRKATAAATKEKPKAETTTKAKDQQETKVKEEKVKEVKVKKIVQCHEYL